MEPHPRRFAIVAALLWLGSGLGGWAEAGIELQTPAGLNPGDQFRFGFVTDGSRDATSTNIADYDSFVNAEAGGATYNGVPVNWLAIVSTASVDAIDHVGQVNAPVYLSDGTLVTTDTTSAGLWFGTQVQLLHAINLDLAAQPPPTFDNFVWTGTNPFGTGFGGAVGDPRAQVGSIIFSNASWVASGTDNSPGRRPFYGISSLLTVPQTAPEPCTFFLVSMCAISLLGSRKAMAPLIGDGVAKKSSRTGRLSGGRSNSLILDLR